jgi:hypothetical protein
VTFLDDVDELAPFALSKQHLAGYELDPFRRPVRHVQDRCHLHDIVSQRHHPAVVRRHDDDTIASSEPSQQPEDLFDLDEVQMCGGLVGEDQRGIERKRTGDRDPLLLAARQTTGAMMHAVTETDQGKQFLRTRPGFLSRPPCRP